MLKQSGKIFHSKKVGFFKTLKSIVRLPFSRHKLLTLEVLFFTVFRDHKSPMVLKMGGLYYFMNYKKIQVNWNGTIYLYFKLFKKLSRKRSEDRGAKPTNKFRTPAGIFPIWEGKNKSRKNSRVFLIRSLIYPRS